MEPEVEARLAAESAGADVPFPRTGNPMPPFPVLINPDDSISALQDETPLIDDDFMTEAQRYQASYRQSLRRPHDDLDAAETNYMGTRRRRRRLAMSPSTRDTRRDGIVFDSEPELELPGISTFTMNEISPSSSPIFAPAILAQPLVEPRQAIGSFTNRRHRSRNPGVEAAHANDFFNNTYEDSPPPESIIPAVLATNPNEDPGTSTETDIDFSLLSDFHYDPGPIPPTPTYFVPNPAFDSLSVAGRRSASPVGSDHTVTAAASREMPIDEWLARPIAPLPLRRRPTQSLSGYHDDSSTIQPTAIDFGIDSVTGLVIYCYLVSSLRTIIPTFINAIPPNGSRIPASRSIIEAHSTVRLVRLRQDLQETLSTLSTLLRLTHVFLPYGSPLPQPLPHGVLTNPNIDTSSTWTLPVLPSRMGPVPRRALCVYYEALETRGVRRKLAEAFTSRISSVHVRLIHTLTHTLFCVVENALPDYLLERRAGSDESDA